MTYSIVARDPATGELGVAVQSHWFAVGPIVPWALPGVGAVATQANAEIAYGPRALELMRTGLDAQSALSRLLAEDAGSAGRQVAVVDARGNVATHTGETCIPFAGHVAGDAVSCQANIMVSERIWPAMLDAYRSAEGPLTQRLLAALDAAEAQGGDARGRQSAAILVVPGEGDVVGQGGLAARRGSSRPARRAAPARSSPRRVRARERGRRTGERRPLRRGCASVSAGERAGAGQS